MELSFSWNVFNAAGMNILDFPECLLQEDLINNMWDLYLLHAWNLFVLWTFHLGEL